MLFSLPQPSAAPDSTFSKFSSRKATPEKTQILSFAVFATNVPKTSLLSRTAFLTCAADVILATATVRVAQFHVSQIFSAKSHFQKNTIFPLSNFRREISQNCSPELNRVSRVRGRCYTRYCDRSRRSISTFLTFPSRKAVCRKIR